MRWITINGANCDESFKEKEPAQSWHTGPSSAQLALLVLQLIKYLLVNASTHSRMARSLNLSSSPACSLASTKSPKLLGSRYQFDADDIWIQRCQRMTYSSYIYILLRCHHLLVPRGARLDYRLLERSPQKIKIGLREPST
jgi:hypothetical protein